MRLVTDSPRPSLRLDPKPYAQAEPLTLRPDVAILVRTLVIRDRFLPDRSFWVAYGNAKLQISRACGWGAPAERYDQAQYEAAMEAYLRGCGV